VSAGGVEVDIPDAGLDLEALESTLIRKALAKAEGNVSKAARLLGLTRRTLQYRLEKLHESERGEAATGAASAPPGVSDEA
jgi:ActR/RegA family two-component response regulator